MPTRLSTSRTATGSVGEIRAPNTRHQATGMPMPSAADTANSPAAISAVDSTVPKVARVKTVHLRAKSSAKSTSRAPANNRKAKKPLSSATGKLTPASSRRMASLIPSCGAAASAAISSIVLASAISSSPTVSGKRKRRWFR